MSLLRRNTTLNESLHWSSFLLVYLLGLFLVGLGYLAMMPVFEGADEPEHYSYIRQIAATETIPNLGSSYLDLAYADYLGPRAYSVAHPPFDSGMVYSKFFGLPSLVASYRRMYREAPSPASFRPSHEINQEAQHPPLYYMLMAPLVEVLGRLSFVTQIFIMRMVSFFLAVTGVAFGLLAVKTAGTTRQIDQATIGFFLYPIILPMFFPEFARIGNDALCIFLVGVLAYLLSSWRRDESNIQTSLAIGVALGLGLLTKAFFIPITAALATFLLVRRRLDKGDAATKARRLLSLLCMFYPAVLIGGWWYLGRLAVFGELSGAVDAITLGHQGGMIAGLKAHFTFFGLTWGIVSTIATFSWGGTGSATFVPLRVQIPLLALIVWIFSAYVTELNKLQKADFAWLPVWLFALFGAGLFYHLLTGLALDGTGQTPGWYLHILMPFTAPAIGIGVCSLLQKARARPFVIGLLLYALLFQIVAIWAQLALFMGCATKGDDMNYAFPSHAFCLDRVPVLVDRLDVLGYPELAAIGFGGGLICALLLIGRWRGHAASVPTWRERLPTRPQ
jgi:hypothetical protein